MGYLTERQQEVLAFVRASLAERGVAPTLQEIADRFGFASTASAQKHVRLLVEKGFLHRTRHQKRGLAPAEPVASANLLPLLGVVAAGSPIESVAGDETVEVPIGLVGRGAHFVLRVRGESMIEEGIRDGDLVIVQAREQARDGETVVALVNGEVTLKRLYREASGAIRLQPANRDMPPLLVPSGDLRVQGVVVGLLRRY